jgi:muramoyltetrapeptide carboxypeptidase
MNNHSRSRRAFIRNSGLAALAAFVSPHVRALGQGASPVKAPRLRPGDKVGLINPAWAVNEESDLEIVKEVVIALGLKYTLGKHVLDRYGYLAGKDQDRAADVNAMFADSSVNCILAVRGGSGCNRILPLLDYDLMSKNPKVVIGYSDITSLLMAIYARCNMVTFHGPVGISTWNQFSVDYFKRILFGGEAVTMHNPTTTGDSLVQTKDRIGTITPGVARGRLVGGNLSVLASMVGSQFLPDWKDGVLFLEDDGEKTHRMDRMLTQLKLSGILDQISGVVFGKCTNCGPDEGYGSLTLEEVLNDHIRPLRIPAWSGAMIGHIENKFTVPLGVQAEIDAERGTIQMLEPAVT